MKIDGEISAEELLRILDKVPLSKNEMRRALRPAAQAFFNEMQSAVSRGWGVRTGRMARDGVKIGVSSRDESGNSAAYRIYFSKAKGTRGTSDYIAPTFVARWLESGTSPHYTSKGATIKKTRRGSLVLNARERKLRHPGFVGRPVAEQTQKKQRANVENITRTNIMTILKKKGVEDA